jgi:hypothetical protein
MNPINCFTEVVQFLYGRLPSGSDSQFSFLPYLCILKPNLHKAIMNIYKYPLNCFTDFVKFVMTFTKHCWAINFPCISSSGQFNTNASFIPWESFHCSLDKRPIFVGHNISIADCYILVSCLACPSTLKMEATSSSRTSVIFRQITCPYIPEDSTFYTHSCENLESYIFFLC